MEEPDNKTIMSFWQAQDAAKKLARGEDGAVGDRPITVAEALDAYARDLEARGGGPYNAKRARKHLQGNAILTTPIAMLTERELKLWRDALIAKKLD